MNYIHALNKMEYWAKNEVCLSDFSYPNYDFYLIKQIALCCLLE